MALRRLWKERRRAKGLTQREAAERLGITRGGLQKIEDGESFITESTLERACRVYDCQPGDLFERDDRVPSEKHAAGSVAAS